MKIEFFRHNIDDDDIKRTVEILRSVFLTTGAVVQDFEKRLAAYLAAKDAVGVSSCTGAIHIGLEAWGIGAGDEVITTPMSFCATANAVIQAGATPVFVDVEEDTGNINAELIEGAITEKTRGIIPVHLYGQLCDMRKIHKIAQKHNLVVVEDAAHAIEAERDGVKPGQLSECACFSFYATKNITSGEGGAISTNDLKKAETLRMLRHHGINKMASERYTKRYEHWDMPVFGWKYNMDNIQAALLIGQLERIDRLWERRNHLWKLYEEGLSGINGIRILKTAAGSRHARHMFTILAPDGKRESILLAMQERGVGVAVNYRPIHLLEYYRKRFGYKEKDFPVAERIGASTITLPLYPLLKDEQAEHVIASVIAVLKKN